MLFKVWKSWLQVVYDHNSKVGWLILFAKYLLSKSFFASKDRNIYQFHHFAIIVNQKNDTSLLAKIYHSL